VASTTAMIRPGGGNVGFRVSVIPLIVFRQGWHYQTQAVNLLIE
jgi:hypothetical protein